MSDYLLIAQENQQLAVVDTAAFNVVKQLDMPGRIVVLGTSTSKRYGFVVHRDDHSITIINGSDATLLKTITTDEQPTHFHAHESQIVIFNDGSGSVTVLDENAINADHRTIQATQPDHGSAVIVGDYLLAGHLRGGFVDVYRIGQPDVLQHFDCCPVLHGAAQIGTTGLFGCSDGVLLVKQRGETFDAIKLDNPADSPPRTRVGLFATHPASPYVLGNFGHGLALIDAEQETMRILPLSGHPLKFSFAEDGATAWALTHDGVLHHIELPSGQLLASNAVVGAVEPPKGPDGKHRPTFTLGAGHVYIVVPDDNTLIEVSAATLQSQRTLALAEQPVGVARVHGESE